MKTRNPLTEGSPVGSGVVVVDKPAGLTSHQIVSRIRRLAGTRKVGHAGTLDPMATGILIVGVNRATRLLGHLMLTEKEYTATIRLGIGTVTDDAEGDVIATPGAGTITEQQIQRQLPAFRGDISQVPTAVSAIKVDGVRSYARVRSGEDVSLKARPVTVHRYDALAVREETVNGVDVLDVDVQVTCSSGTYIRALARDLGVALGSAGHLTVLRRTRVGSFWLDRAVTLEQAADDLGLIDLATVAREAFPVFDCTAEQASAIRHGRRLPETSLPGDLSAMITAEEEFLALYRQVGTDARPESVFVS